MAIITMEVRGVRGLGDVPAAAQSQFVPLITPYLPSLPGGARAVVRSMSPPDTFVPVGSDTSPMGLLRQYGPSIGAGVGGLLLGLVIAKAARRRRKS